MGKMENLKLEDFLNYSFMSDIEYSPNKENACFAVHKCDYDSNSYTSDLWLYSKRDKLLRQLTSSGDGRSFAWLDNERIIFPGLRDDLVRAKINDGEKWTVFYVISINGGEAVEYMRVPFTVKGIWIIDENRSVMTVRYDNGSEDMSSLEGLEKEKTIKKQRADKDYQIIDELPFWANGDTYTNKLRDVLYIYDRRDKSVKLISERLSNVRSTAVKNGKVLYAACPNHGVSSLYEELYLYDTVSEENKKLVSDGQYTIRFADFVGDNIVFLGSPMDKYTKKQNLDFYVFKEGKEEVFFRHDFGYSNTVGTDCKFGGGNFGSGNSYRILGNKIYFISTEEKNAFIKEISLDGTCRKLTGDDVCIDYFDVCDDELLYIGMKDYKLEEIYSTVEGKTEAVSAFNSNIIADKKISVPECFEYENDGIKFKGFVIKPVDYDDKKQYPAILDIHGGPKTVYGEVYYHEMQCFASKGYFVFFCNPRGSDGRGNDFANLKKQFGTVDYDDIMGFTDVVLDRYPQIDKSRLGVTGGSYGGYMTNWIIGHTDRFRCAVSQRSIASWISQFGASDVGYLMASTDLISMPWDDIESLWKHSPMKYAKYAKTPTLFIHSDQDYRCWIAEGYQMFSALKFLGVETRMCIFKGENHELSRSGKPQHRLKRLEEITDWFDKYLK